MDQWGREILANIDQLAQNKTENIYAEHKHRIAAAKANEKKQIASIGEKWRKELIEAHERHDREASKVGDETSALLKEFEAKYLADVQATSDARVESHHKYESLVAQVLASMVEKVDTMSIEQLNELFTAGSVKVKTEDGKEVAITLGEAE